MAARLLGEEGSIRSVVMEGEGGESGIDIEEVVVDVAVGEEVELFDDADVLFAALLRVLIFLYSI